jgi:hypothetical protein
MSCQIHRLVDWIATVSSNIKDDMFSVSRTLPGWSGRASYELDPADMSRCRIQRVYQLSRAKPWHWDCNGRNSYCQ